MPTRGADGKGLESARQSLPNTFHVHADSLNYYKISVNFLTRIKVQ